MRTYLSFLALLTSCAVGAAWYSLNQVTIAPSAAAVSDAPEDVSWLEDLHSQNPREVSRAAARLKASTSRARSIVGAALRDGSSTPERRKAALRACGLLGAAAVDLIPDVAGELSESGLTDEAAVALSYMGRDAFPPLRDALASHDPVVRREALRAIGKLRSRAPLDARQVVPLLSDGMRDVDSTVRTVAATYLGILHEESATAVPLLIAGLSDDDVHVRRASAEALGSFGVDAERAIPALRRASSDRDEDVAREAITALVRLRTDGQ